MTIELPVAGTQTMSVAGLDVTVVRKRIRNLHLGVYPPEGRVRVAVPMMISDAAVRVAIIDKLPWIKQQRAGFTNQARESQREFVTGESHFYLGRRYRLEVVTVDQEARPVGRGSIVIRGNSTMLMIVPRGATSVDRSMLLQAWYRARLRAMVPSLLAKWEAHIGVGTKQWGIRRMKTKWGSCNPIAQRIWLNAELIKKPLTAIEYVIVHELIHLRARKHDGAFVALLNATLPSWRRQRDALNESTLVAETWRE
jgi:predicted metal-dependent hydrolase